MKKTFILLPVLFYIFGFTHSQTITEIVPIVSDNQVKLEISLSNGEKKGPVVINGKISSCKDGKVIWDGAVANIEMAGASDTVVTCFIKDIQADLWSPATPNLYSLEISCNKSVVNSRIGFRKFEMKNGQFYLNGNRFFSEGMPLIHRKGVFPTNLKRAANLHAIIFAF